MLRNFVCVKGGKQLRYYRFLQGHGEQFVCSILASVTTRNIIIFLLPKFFNEKLAKNAYTLKRPKNLYYVCRKYFIIEGLSRNGLMKIKCLGVSFHFAFCSRQTNYRKQKLSDEYGNASIIFWYELGSNAWINKMRYATTFDLHRMYCISAFPEYYSTDL